MRRIVPLTVSIERIVAETSLSLKLFADPVDGAVIMLRVHRELIQGHEIYRLWIVSGGIAGLLYGGVARHQIMCRTLGNPETDRDAVPKNVDFIPAHFSN